MISALLASTAEAAAHAPEATGEVGKFAAQFGIEPAYLAWQFGSFSLLAIVLYRFGIKPLLSTMDERQRKIEDGLKFFEDQKANQAAAEKQAESTLAKAAVEAAASLSAARATAEARISAASQDAIAKANEIIAKGNEAVALERAKMLAEVRAEVARLVVATSGKVLSRELSADEKSRYAESAAKELAAR
jgi:F-type H+-transporting ATPase subunit b